MIQSDGQTETQTEEFHLQMYSTSLSTAEYFIKQWNTLLCHKQSQKFSAMKVGDV